MMEDLVRDLLGSDVHSHKCGYDEENAKKTGCGFVWTHDAVDLMFASEKDHANAHCCPKCGNGPWFWKSARKIQKGRG